MIQGKKRRICGLLMMAAAGMVSLPLTTSLAASFDGNWDVVVICPAEPNGAKAFTLRYKAEVKNGIIHGQYGTNDQPGSQSIDGQIEPNGTAMLTVSARFEGNKGTGSRQQDRSCTFSFVRKF